MLASAITPIRSDIGFQKYRPKSSKIYFFRKIIQRAGGRKSVSARINYRRLAFHLGHLALKRRGFQSFF